MVPFRSHLAPAGTGLNRVTPTFLPTQRPGRTRSLEPEGRILRAAASNQACAAWIPALALLAGALAAGAADHEALLERWLEQQARTQTWKADLTQIRSLKTLAQPLVGTGRVYVLMPDTFRWELGDPPRTIALRTATELILSYPMLDRVERHPLDAQASGPARQGLALLNAGFPQSRADLERQFDIQSTMTNKDHLLLLLTPRNRDARRMIKSIQVEVIPDTLTLTATELLFTDGSTVRNEFRNAEINPPLPPELFQLPAASPAP